MKLKRADNGSSVSTAAVCRYSTDPDLCIRAENCRMLLQQQLHVAAHVSVAKIHVHHMRSADMVTRSDTQIPSPVSSTDTRSYFRTTCTALHLLKTYKRNSSQQDISPRLHHISSPHRPKLTRSLHDTLAKTVHLLSDTLAKMAHLVGI